MVEADADRLSQVFINLISNAVKYNNDPSPEVTVSSMLRKGVYEARVTDNGPGIPERDRERIFVKFARGPAPRQSGAGLGLAISRQIIERFGGQIYCAEATKAGATFVVRLPARIRRT